MSYLHLLATCVSVHDEIVLVERTECRSGNKYISAGKAGAGVRRYSGWPRSSLAAARRSPGLSKKRPRDRNVLQIHTLRYRAST